MFSVLTKTRLRFISRLVWISWADRPIVGRRTERTSGKWRKRQILYALSDLSMRVSETARHCNGIPVATIC